MNIPWHWLLLGSSVIGAMIWLRNKLIKLARMETEKKLNDVKKASEQTVKDKSIDELVAESNARRRSRSSSDH